MLRLYLKTLYTNCIKLRIYLMMTGNWNSNSEWCNQNIILPHIDTFFVRSIRIYDIFNNKNTYLLLALGNYRSTKSFYADFRYLYLVSLPFVLQKFSGLKSLRSGPSRSPPWEESHVHQLIPHTVWSQQRKSGKNMVDFYQMRPFQSWVIPWSVKSWTKKFPNPRSTIFFTNILNVP